jgi:uncharacterized protein (TIGR02466 family)
MDLSVENLFPIPLGIVSLDKHLTKKELQYINNLELTQNEGNKSSLDNYVLDNKELLRVGAVCQQAAQKFFDEVYQPKEKIGLSITQSWANFTGENEYHHKHYHTNSFISGVLYIDTNIETDKLHFFKEVKNTFLVATENYNQWNSESWWYPTAPNTILLFPSSLSHMVVTKPTPEKRISIAFNTFFKGNLGRADQLNELKL